MQNAVSTKTYTVGLFVGFEMQVRRALLDRIQQHLVDEAYNGRFIGLAAFLTLLIIGNGLDLQTVQVSITHVIEAAGGAIQILVDSCTELVVFDNDCVSHKPGIELDVAEGLLVGRVGQGKKQTVSTFV